MKISEDRTLVTHAGSLIKPPNVIEQLQAKDFGEPVDEEQLDHEVTEAVKAVVKKQREVGVDVPNDGEMGKTIWTGYQMERLTGIEAKPPSGAPAGIPLGIGEPQFAEFWEQYRAHEATLWMWPGVKVQDRMPPALEVGYTTAGPITYRGHELVQRDIANLKAALRDVPHEEAFLPVVAPASAELMDLEGYYKTEEELLYALADALNEEYRAIVDAGLLVQLDDCLIVWMYNVIQDIPAYRKWAELRVEATNHALKGIPPEKVRYHVCWGSQNSPHVIDVPLKEAVDILMKLNVQAYSIEAANPRHEHEWMLWQDFTLPDDKVLIPGIVTHSTSVVEHPELVAWRIKNFASVVGRERVLAGTDCGFCQAWWAIRVHPTVQWAKLETLAQGAELASKDLWGR